MDVKPSAENKAVSPPATKNQSKATNKGKKGQKNILLMRRILDGNKQTIYTFDLKQSGDFIPPSTTYKVTCNKDTDLTIKHFSAENDLLNTYTVKHGEAFNGVILPYNHKDKVKVEAEDKTCEFRFTGVNIVVAAFVSLLALLF